MRIIVEIDNEKEVAQYEGLLKLISSASRRRTAKDKYREIELFLDRVDRMSISTERVRIPNREERNAR